MALELGIDVVRAHRDIDSINKKMMGLANTADKVGGRLDKAFGRKAFREFAAALKTVRTEMNKTLNAQARQLAEAKRLAGQSTKLVSALKAESNAHAQVASATTQSNATGRQKIVVSQRMAKTALDAAQGEQRLARETEKAAGNAKRAVPAHDRLAGAQNRRAKSSRGAAAATAIQAQESRFAVRALRSFTGSMDVANQGAAAFRAGLIASGAGFGIFTGSTIIAASAVFGLAAAIRSSIQFGAEYERAFERTIVISGAVGDEATLLSRKIRDLGATTQFTATEVAQASTELAQAGLAPVEIFSTLEDTLTMSAIGMMDLAKSAQITVNTMRAFQMDATEMTHAVDVMAHAITTSSLTLQDMAISLRFAGPAAATAGASIEDVSAALAILGNVGIKGSKAGTAMRRTFVNLVKPTTEGARALTDLGVATTDSTGELRNMVDIFEDLADSGATSMDLVKIFGVRAFSAVSTVLEQSTEAANETGKSFRNVRDTMDELDGTSRRMREALEDNLEVKFLALKSAIQEVQIAAFDLFGGELRSKIDQLTGYIRENATSIAFNLARVVEGVAEAFEFVIRNARTLFGLLAGWAAFKVGITVASLLRATISSLTGAVTASHRAFRIASVSIRRYGKSAVFTMKSARGLGAALMASLGPLSLLATAVGAVYTGYQAYNIGVDEATDGTYAFQTATDDLTKSLRDMSRATLGVRMLEAEDDVAELTNTVKNLRSEIEQIQNAGASMPSRGVLERRARFNTTGFGSLPSDVQESLIDNEAVKAQKAMAAESEELRRKQIKLAAAEEQLAHGREYLDKVSQAHEGTLKAIVGATGSAAGANEQLSDSLKSLYAKIIQSTDLIGKNERAAFKYRATYGDLSATLAQTILQQDDGIQKLEEERTALLKSRDALEEGSEAYQELSRQLAENKKETAELTATKNEEARQLAINLEMQRIAAQTAKEQVDAYLQMNGSIIPYMQRLAELDATQKEFNKSLSFAEGKAEDFGVSVEVINQALEAGKTREQLNAVSAALGVTFKGMDKLGQVMAESAREFPTLTKVLDAAAEALEGLKIEGEDASKILEGLKDNYEEIGPSILKAVRHQKEQNAAFIQGERSLAIFNSLWEQTGGHVSEATDEMRKGAVALYDLKKQMERMEEVRNIFQNLGRTIESTFVDVLTGSIDSFTDFRDAIVDGFKQMIAELIVIAARNQIMLSIGAGGGGFLSGMIGGAAGGMGAGAAGGAAAGGMSAGTGALGAAGLYLSSIGAGAGSFLGGASLGGAAYAGAGSTAGVAGAATGAALTGTALGFGSGNLVNNMMGGQGSEGRTNSLAAIGGLIGSMWGPLGSLVGGAIGGMVSNALGGAREQIASGLELGLRNGEVVARQFTTVREHGGWGSSDKIIRTTRAASDDVVAALNAQYQEMFAQVEAAAESLGVSTNRLTGFTGTTTSINLQGISKEMQEELIQRALRSNVVAALREFVSETEGISDRMRETFDALTTQMSELAVGGGALIEAFKMMADLDNAISTDPLQVAQDFFKAQDSSLQVFRDQAEQVRQATAAYDGSMESLRALTEATRAHRDMAVEVAIALERVSREVTNMFTSSMNTIQESLMGEEELYEFRSDQVDQLVAAMATMTSPEQILATASQIDQLTSAMYGSLDESQQQALGPDFLEFYEEMLALVQAQIDEGREEVGETTEEINAFIDTTMLDIAAEAQIQAAADLRRAAAELRVAAETMGSGSSTGSSGGDALTADDIFENPNANELGASR